MGRREKGPEFWSSCWVFFHVLVGKSLCCFHITLKWNVPVSKHISEYKPAAASLVLWRSRRPISVLGAHPKMPGSSWPFHSSGYFSSKLIAFSSQARLLFSFSTSYHSSTCCISCLPDSSLFYLPLCAFQSWGPEMSGMKIALRGANVRKELDVLLNSDESIAKLVFSCFLRCNYWMPPKPKRLVCWLFSNPCVHGYAGLL